MEARRITPILNVSDLPASFVWFANLSWRKGWDWSAAGAEAPTFGSAASGDCEIFLCLDGRGDAVSTGYGSGSPMSDVEGILLSAIRPSWVTTRTLPL